MSSPVRLVLVRPQNPENAGAAARAMKNFGLTDWAWVSPEFDDPAPAQRLAVHATDLLGSVRRCDSLEAAVADCGWVVGTSSRTREGKRRIGPRAFAKEALERAVDAPVALVFGSEQSGLSNVEIDLCHDLCGVPTDDAQPSINLAQTVLLFAYELRMAALERDPVPPGRQAAPARDETLRAIERALTAGLGRAGFLQHSGRHAVRDLLATLVRARLSAREASLWSAALHAVDKALKG